MLKTLKRLAVLIGFLAALLIFFRFTFLHDNRYTVPPANAAIDGALLLTEADFQSAQPQFLIDEWRLRDGVVPPGDWENSHSRGVYVGEFPDYRRYKPERTPLGSGTYQKVLRYDGSPRVASLVLPELYTNYQLWWDDAPLDTGSGSTRVNLWLTEGKHTLTVAVMADRGYHAGMYVPGFIGSASTLLQMEHIQTAAYGISILLSLALAAFCLGLWKQNGNRLRRALAFLCLSFAFYQCHYFVYLWQLPFAAYWYPLEIVSLYALLYFALVLSLDACGLSSGKYVKALRLATLVLAAAEVALYFLTSVWPDAVRLHNIVKNSYQICVFTGLLLLSIQIVKQSRRESNLILCANTALGIGLLLNVVSSNLFAPIYTLSQFEWCALLMVALFAAVMVRQNLRLQAEGALYQTQLESTVRQRTSQLDCVLEERRVFFTDMALNLDAPLQATNGFIQMARRHAVGLDEELQLCMEQVKKKQEDMARRIQSLSDISEVDRITTEPEHIAVDDLMQELYLTHNPEAVASGIHLVVPPPECAMSVFLQKEKLLMAFENIIYNALRFTSMNGCIVVTAEPSGSQVCFSVADTGCGIPSNELPHVFERFYKGDAGKSTGSGLGLYIVKTIIDEAGGTVSAESTEGKGSTIEMRLPNSYHGQEKMFL